MSRLAILLAGMTLLMILFGGMVTTYEAGDSDPEWSLKFWEWFRSWEEMPGGQLYEITHRQIGTIIGFITIAFIVVLFRSEKRWWVKYLGILILTAVVLQGLLGGLRVLVISDPAMQAKFLSVTGLPDPNAARIASAMIHAGLAQLIFGAIAAIVLVNSRSWFTKTPDLTYDGVLKLRRVGAITIIVVFIEIMLGTYVRHASRGVSDHIFFAVIAAVLAIHLSIRAISLGPRIRPLRGPAVILAVVIPVQVILGVTSIIHTAIIDFAPTLHVIGGSVILAASVVLTVRAFDYTRDLAPAKS